MLEGDKRIKGHEVEGKVEAKNFLSINEISQIKKFAKEKETKVSGNRDKK